MKDRKRCGVAGCPHPHEAKGYCKAHYQRLWRAGNVSAGKPIAIVIRGPLVCTVDGCDRKHKAKGYCTGHLARIVRTGELNPEVPLRPQSRDRKCPIEGCDNERKRGALCSFHSARQRLGLPVDLAVDARRWRIAQGHPKAITCSGAHQRCETLWGKAALYPCIGCDKAAADWAYDGTDPTEMLVLEQDKRGTRYSISPEFYMPMCKKCHRNRDLALARQELFEYRVWKNSTGMTLADLS